MNNHKNKSLLVNLNDKHRLAVMEYDYELKQRLNE